MRRLTAGPAVVLTRRLQRLYQPSVLRRGLAFLALVASLCGIAPEDASAHAGLVLSDPAAGVALGDTPTAVRLTFSEHPEASLSVIRVLDSGGVARQIGRPEPVSGNPLSLVVRVSRLGRGVYTVSWRVVSAVDGHAASGAYAFGVGVAPTGAAATAGTTNPATSQLEMLARWIYLAGLVVLLGAAFAGVARFGGSTGYDLRLGAGGWLLSVVGLVLLSDAQRRNASAPIGELLHTSVGRALLWRAVPIGAAGAALLVARRAHRPFRRVTLAGAVLAASAAMAVHVSAGHAGAGTWPHTLSVAVQWAHFSAAGIWIGGLAALLLGLRGAPSASNAAAVRRFSTVAAAGLIVVAASGLTRAVEELAAWGDLVSTGYGRGVLAKIALLLAITALGARNRLRSVPAAASNLGVLRRTSSAELVLAAGALAVAAVLGSLAPPAAERVLAPLGVTVSGADSGGTVQVRLTAASAAPGPNRFVARVDRYGSRTPVQARSVSLRFTPLDDPGVASSSLELRPGPDYAYSGSGANVVFDGRWGVRVVIQPYVGRTVEVPLELDAQAPAQFVSIERRPGLAPKYTVQVGNVGAIRVSPDPEKAGRSKVYVTCYDVFEDGYPAEQVVVVAAAGDGPTRRQQVRRLGPAQFVADVDLQPGPNTIAVVARTVDGRRLRASVELEIPSG